MNRKSKNNLNNNSLNHQKKDKIWNILLKNNDKEFITKHKRFFSNFEKSKKKIVPLFIDDEKKVYERQFINHKYEIFKDEKNKKFTNKKMNGIFYNLYENKNNFYKKNRNKFLSYDNINNNYYNFNNTNEIFDNNLNSEENKNNYFEDNSNNDNKYEDDSHDELKLLKNLEKKYNFYANKNSLMYLKKRDKLNKLFKNNNNIQYFHFKNKLKEAHLMDLSPENVLNYSNKKNYLTNINFYKFPKKKNIFNNSQNIFINNMYNKKFNISNGFNKNLLYFNFYNNKPKENEKEKYITKYVLKYSK